MTALVVDDEALLRAAIATALLRAGFEVLVARDADEAMRLLQEHGHVDAVLTDVEMPGSMDGLALASAIRRQWPGTAIAVTSGRTWPGKGDLPEGAVFVPKPFGLGAVVQLMDELIAASRGRTRNAGT